MSLTRHRQRALVNLFLFCIEVRGEESLNPENRLAHIHRLTVRRGAVR